MADDDIVALRAMAHPLRLRILSLLTGAELSAADVARELGITHANASYHLRVLHDAHLVVDAGEERIRGGVARRYRYPHERQEWSADGPKLTGQLRAMAQEMVRRHLRGSSRPRTYTDAELWVTPEVWEEIVDIIQRVSARMHEEAQPARTPGTVKASLTVAAFRMEEQ